MNIFKVTNSKCLSRPQFILSCKNFFCLFICIFLIFSFSATISHSHECSDYIIDVRLIEFFELDGPQTHVGESMVRLELLFSLQHHNSRAIFQVIGGGTAINFQRIFGSEFGRLTINATISDVVKKTIRDGYRQLNELLKEQGLEEQPLTCVVNRVQGNRVNIPLGLNYVQEGDIFYIYPKENYNSNKSNLANSLTTATVIETNQNSSILEMNIIQNGGKSVQTGDIVELANNTNVEQRKNTLKLSPVPNIFVTLRLTETSTHHNRLIRRNINPYINHYLATEASNFGFQVVQ